MIQGHGRQFVGDPVSGGAAVRETGDRGGQMCRVDGANTAGGEVIDVHGAPGHLRAEHFQQPGEAVGAQIAAGSPGADRVEPGGTGAVEPPRVCVRAAPGPSQPAPRAHQGGEAGQSQPGRQRPAVGDRLRDRAQQRRQPGKHLPPVVAVRELPQRLGPRPASNGLTVRSDGESVVAWRGRPVAVVFGRRSATPPAR